MKYSYNVESSTKLRLIGTPATNWDIYLITPLYDCIWRLYDFKTSPSIHDCFPKEILLYLYGSLEIQDHQLERISANRTRYIIYRFSLRTLSCSMPHFIKERYQTDVFTCSNKRSEALTDMVRHTHQYMHKKIMPKAEKPFCISIYWHEVRTLYWGR